MEKAWAPPIRLSSFGDNERYILCFTRALLSDDAPKTSVIIHLQCRFGFISTMGLSAFSIPLKPKVAQC